MVVISWTGRGYVPLVIFISACFAVTMLHLVMIGPVGEGRAVCLVLATACLVSAVAAAPLGRVVLLPVYGRKDALGGIDVRRWTLVFAVMALALLGLGIAGVPL